MTKVYKVIHKKSNVVIDGAPKLPSSGTVEYGEIAVNYAASAETLSIRNANNVVVPFSSDYIINQRIAASGLPQVTIVDELKVLQVVNGAWSVVMPLVVYSGEDTPSSSLGNNGDIYLQTAEALRAPDVLYETDGTTGLLGHNQSDYAGRWQLENLNLSPYKMIKCYFKATTSTDSSKYTPAIIVDVPLDAAAMGTSTYFGSQMVPLPFNRNRQYLVSCAVDGTKTKFQVVHQNTIWDVTTSDANNEGRYLYKIEGWY